MQSGIRERIRERDFQQEFNNVLFPHVYLMYIHTSGELSYQSLILITREKIKGITNEKFTKGMRKKRGRKKKIRSVVITYYVTR